jgi:hypothetical protein
MSRTETRPPPLSSGSDWAASEFDDMTWSDEADRDGAPLLRLFGAAALAIFALAGASLVLV